MTSVATQRESNRHLKSFGLAVVLNMLWINLSEVFRYFVFVMPMMREAFATIPDIAPMNLSVFLIWGIWDTILVMAVCSLAWLIQERFGTSLNVVMATSTGIWATIFVILWLGLFNMNLATPMILLAALPLAWVEMFVAVCIVRWAQVRAH